MFCDRLLDIFRRHPSFPAAPVDELLRQEIALWHQPGTVRPDHACLEEAWEFGRRMVGARIAQPADVAGRLFVAIVEGPIDPFGALTAEVVDSHLLTSNSRVSLELCKKLRDAKEVVSGQGQHFAAFGSAFIRGVVLGFGWEEQFSSGGSLSALADRATPEELLRAYRLASAMAGDRQQAARTDEEVRASWIKLRGVCDGIVDRLHRGSGAGSTSDEQSRRVVRVIELERVVQAMVDLLAHSGAARDEALARAGLNLGLGRPGGPISHLREYVALGTPLINLVGQEQQADVRRDIERLMEGVTSAVLPGFPDINSLGSSRRPSELLRRLRFLVRAMVLEAAKPGSHQVFRDFRRDLFHGEGQDCGLAAARIAFERPERPSGWRTPANYDKCEDPVYLGIRARLQNLLVASGFHRCASGEAASHPFIGALRGAVKIDIDTWSDARDGDSPALPEAVLDLLRSADAVVEGADEDEEFSDGLVEAVFSDSLIGASAGGADRTDVGEAREGFFFRLKPPALKWQFEDQRSDAVRRAIESGLSGFQRFIRANFHREFDRHELHQIAGWGMFAQHDEDSSSDEGEACREWLQAWAYVTKGDFESAGVLVGDSASASTLAADVIARPFEQDPYSGGSLLFRYADAAAEGNDRAKAALEEIMSGASVKSVIEAAEADMVGRPVGLALAQGASRTTLSKLYGPGRGFDVGLGMSTDGVTPSMAAVRFAARSANDLEHRQRITQVLADDASHAGGKDPHDGRGWRLIHHAFAGGNLDAARMLFERNPACIRLRDGDQTTFLIEAVRHPAKLLDPGEVFRAAWGMLMSLDRAEQTKILSFAGPESTLGSRLSLVSAALRTLGRWPLLMDVLQDAGQREAILSVVGARELNQLLRDVNDARFSLFCKLVTQTARGGDRLRESLSEITPSPAILAVAGIRAGDRRGAEHSVRAITATQKKLKDLHSHGALDLGRVEPFSRNNALHELVEYARHSTHRDDNAGLLYDLAWEMVQSAPIEQRAALVSSPNLEGETPVWLASRHGMHSLALAYAQFMGGSLSGGDRSWLEAARVIRDPNRYQDGVVASRRLFVDDARRLCLRCGAERRDEAIIKVLVLSHKPLPEDINVRSARAWLFENANVISAQLKAHFGIDSDIPASAFVNWLAHLALETVPQTA